MTTRQATCAERVETELQDRLADLRKLLALYLEDPDAYDNDLGNLNEYGLGFDYVPPGTFPDQEEGYFRYQLSWGGPSDEFRIYADQINRWQWSIYRIEYWFLDWFDGAHSDLGGDDLEFMKELALDFLPDLTHYYEQAIR